MRLVVSFGKPDSRTLVFEWSQATNRVAFTLDGSKVRPTSQDFGLGREGEWIFDFPAPDPHRVVFTRIKTLIWAEFRPQTVIASVDGVEVARATEGPPRLVLIAVIALWIVALAIGVTLFVVDR